MRKKYLRLRLAPTMKEKLAFVLDAIKARKEALPKLDLYDKELNWLYEYGDRVTRMRGATSARLWGKVYIDLLK